MPFLVYTISDPTTGEIRYVGKSERGLAVRKAEHSYNAHRRHGKTHLYCWLRSLQQAPLYETVEECRGREDLIEAESFWISQFRALGFRLTNHTDGGDGFHMAHSAETKAKMSAALKGRPKPPEVVQKIAEATKLHHKEHPEAHKHSEETKRKISDGLKRAWGNGTRVTI